MIAIEKYGRSGLGKGTFEHWIRKDGGMELRFVWDET